MEIIIEFKIYILTFQVIWHLKSHENSTSDVALELAEASEREKR